MKECPHPNCDYCGAEERKWCPKCGRMLVEVIE